MVEEQYDNQVNDENFPSTSRLRTIVEGAGFLTGWCVVGPAYEGISKIREIIKNILK